MRRPPTLTIGIPTYDDTDNVIWTVQAFRMMHEEFLDDIELVVVDNHPGSKQSERLVHFLKKISDSGLMRSNQLPDGVESFRSVRYVPYPERIGTAPAKNAIFEHASGTFVLCIDSHILMPPKAIEELYFWCKEAAAEPANRHQDLYTGPLLFLDLNEYRTHFSSVWGTGMKGQWQVMHEQMKPNWESEEGENPLVPCGYNSEPFEVPAMGMGCFLSRRDSWLKYNPNFRGFGGEEWYIHEKYRKAGRKVVLLPFMRWWHLFRDETKPAPFPTNWGRTCQNFVIGWSELGLPLDEIYQEYVVTRKYISEEVWQNICDSPESLTLFPVKHSDRKPGKPVKPKAEPAKGTCVQCELNGMIKQKVGLETIWRTLTTKGSDLKAHLPVLRKYAGECQSVAEHCHHFGFTTTAFALGLPAGGTLISNNPDVQFHADFGAMCEDRSVTFQFNNGRFLSYPEDTVDMLLLDTLHTADHVLAELEKYGKHVNKYIAIHDTHTFGREAPGNQPGCLYGIAKWLESNLDWVVVHESDEDHGMIILSRVVEDMPEKPSLVTSAMHYAQAQAKKLKRTLSGGTNSVPDPIYAIRLDRCLLCPHRSKEACGECGCPIADKAREATQSCPLEKPRWTALTDEQMKLLVENAPKPQAQN